MKKSKKATAKFNHILLGVSAIIFGFSAFACGVGFIKFRIGAVKTPIFTASYSAQDNKIFYHDKWVYDADARTFQLLGYGFAQDNNNIFYDGRTIPEADYQTFTVLSYGIATDRNQVWIFDKPTGVNTNQRITPLGNLYFQKGSDVYYQSRKINEADASTFSSMSVDHMARDKNYFYFKGRQVTR